MNKRRKFAFVGGVLGLFAAVGAFFGPFVTSEAMEGTIERIRRMRR
jgi:uncharacterized protein YqgC (DUF456 family)